MVRRGVGDDAGHIRQASDGVPGDRPDLLQAGQDIGVGRAAEQHALERGLVGIGHGQPRFRMDPAVTIRYSSAETPCTRFNSAARSLFSAQALENAAVLHAERGDVDAARAAYLAAIDVYSELGADWDIMRRTAGCVSATSVWAPAARDGSRSPAGTA